MVNSSNYNANQYKFSLISSDKAFGTYRGYFKSLQAAKNWFARCDKDLRDNLSIGLELDGKYRLLASRAKGDKKWLNFEKYKDEFKTQFKVKK